MTGKQHILALTSFFLKQEFRKGLALFSNVLYLAIFIFFVSTLFHEFIGKENLQTLWMSLFWLSSMYTISLSFTSNATDSNLFSYYYQLMNPKSFAIAKLITNLLIGFFYMLIIYGVFRFSWGGVVYHEWHQLLNILVGATAFTSIFTLFSLISSQAKSNSSLIYLMTLPVMLPLLVLLLEISTNTLEEFLPINYWSSVGVIFLLSLVMSSLTVLLFPFVWRK